MQTSPRTHMAAAPGADMSGMANIMAMQGRKGDDTLVHMKKTELPYLNMLARSAGYPRGLPINPKTGLPEANILKSILPVAGAILGGMFLPGAFASIGLSALGKGALATGVGAGLGSFGGGLASGQSFKDAAIGGLISGGLSGLGAGMFGNQSLMGVPQTVGQATPEIVAQGVQQAGEQTLSAGLPAGLPEAGFGTNFATAAPTNIPADVARNMVTFPEGLAPSAKLFSEAVPLNTINKIQSMPLDPGFTDIGVLNKYDPNLFSSKLDYMKYAAKPAMTAGAVGLGVDAALERGAFEPIDYSSYYEATEMDGPSPLPRRGLRFESERTGAFPRTAEEALAFAQPGGARQRFFNQRFVLPAKTGGGIAALQTGGRTAFSAAFEEEEDAGEVGFGAPPGTGGIGMDSADAAGLVGSALGLGLGVPALGVATNALGQVGQYYSAPEAQRGSLRFEPLSLLPFTDAPTIGQQHTNLTTQDELNAALEADQEAEAAAAQAAALASTLTSIDQATIDEAEEAAPAPATAAAFGLADTESAAQGAVAAAEDAAVAQANAAHGLATLESGIGGPGAGAGIGGPGTSGLGIDVALGIDDYAGFGGYGDYGDAPGDADVGGIGSGAGPGSGYGDEGFGGIGGEEGDADADGGAGSAGDDGPGGTGGSDDYQYGGLVQLPQSGLISAYQMGGSPSPYFEGRVVGKGDGMSDSISFSIEGEQPAILSRDEYVLPADIVAMMGNGSSNAGAEKIDSFINDFRMQKYGRGEQPPETSRGLSSIG